MIIIPKNDQIGQNFLYPADNNNVQKYVIKKDFSDLADTNISHLQNMAKIAGIQGVITYYTTEQLIEFIKANIQFE
jgi:hypothetical protein